MIPSEFLPNRLFIRNISAGKLLDYFLISSIGTILLIRAYLDLTGYPQIGFGDFHIAHVLWGGLLMLISVVLVLSFLSATSRLMASIIGGVGFGVFIDELGKFITADNNYFYQPTAAILYVLFIILFLSFRTIESYQKFSPQEYLANALELMENVVFNDLDVDEKSRIRRFLSLSSHKNPLVAHLEKFINEAEALPKIKPGMIARFWSKLGLFYETISTNKYFIKLVILLFILHASLALVSVVILGNVFLFTQHNVPVTSLQLGGLISAFIAEVPIIIGISRILHSRLFAYRMFRISVLISIFLVQFFSFYFENFSAFFTFLGNVLILIALDYMITRERTLELKQLKRIKSI